MAVDWDERMLRLAARIALWSKDPSTKVGALVVRPDHSIASQGFNGFPRGVHDDPERYENRDIKYKMIVHAEANALASAHVPVRGMRMYTTVPPCASCAGLIIQHGIVAVVTVPPTPEQIERWGDSLEIMETMFEEADVELIMKELVLC